MQSRPCENVLVPSDYGLVRMCCPSICDKGSAEVILLGIEEVETYFSEFPFDRDLARISSFVLSHTRNLVMPVLHASDLAVPRPSWHPGIELLRGALHAGCPFVAFVASAGGRERLLSRVQ